MPQLTQGLIVAVLIGLLLAIIVGYYLRQSQVNELSEALQQSQQRQADLAQEHEQRLREATLQLQKDYEAQLSERMERYQAQYDEQRSQMEAEYQARQTMMGGAAGEGDSSIEQRIRKQYEARLKEAATKIQQAYEQHLQEKLVEARSQAQQDYDQRLAEAIAHYQDEAQARLAQGPDTSLGALVPEPSPAISASSTDLAEVEARLQTQYDQRLAERLAEYQDDMAQRLAQMQQDYEARLQLAQASAPAAAIAAEPSTEELELNLRRELEASLREEYEQKLAEKIEHYQDELTQRTQELEQSYEAQLRLLQSSSSAPADVGEFDLDTAIAAASAATLATSLESGLEDTFSSPEATALPASDADLGTDLGFDAALLGGGSESSPGSEFILDPDSDTENLETSSLDLEETFPAEPDAPSAADADLGFDAALLESGLETVPDNEVDAASGLDPETFETTSLEPDLDLEGGFSLPESAAPPAADVDLGFDAALLDSDLGNEPGNEFDLDFGGALDTEPPAPPAASADLGFDDFLAGDLETTQGDEFALDPNFDTANFDDESLDLDALLNAPPPNDSASDDLLNDLDDISDLS
ncbi:hypothetical protein ACQ4N7_07590 [Nodosilinea sp. AN01ver1]|uniref:hypothetical protein n=1 Tax=Nodosilinea sp. AN01ver1 TaxID=3423362 RepID=UPI003D31F643